MKIIPKLNGAFFMLAMTAAAIVPAGILSLMGIHVATGALVLTAPAYAVLTPIVALMSHFEQEA